MRKFGEIKRFLILLHYVNTNFRTLFSTVDCYKTKKNIKIYEISQYFLEKVLNRILLFIFILNWFAKLF